MIRRVGTVVSLGNTLVSSKFYEGSNEVNGQKRIWAITGNGEREFVLEIWVWKGRENKGRSNRVT